MQLLQQCSAGLCAVQCCTVSVAAATLLFKIMPKHYLPLEYLMGIAWNACVQAGTAEYGSVRCRDVALKFLRDLSMSCWGQACTRERRLCTEECCDQSDAFGARVQDAKFCLTHRTMCAMGQCMACGCVILQYATVLQDHSPPLVRRRAWADRGTAAGCCAEGGVFERAAGHAAHQ